jgi:hypothetical protein
MTIAARSGAVIDKEPSTFTTYILYLFSYLSRYTHYNLTTGGIDYKGL